jgi:AcrR family transcriptional regulator
VGVAESSVEQKGADSRTRILEAAIDVIAELGYRRASIAIFAKRAGLSAAGLMHHFPTKDALLEAVIAYRDAHDRAASLLSSQQGGSAGLRQVGDVMRRNDDRPALSRLFAVLVASNLAPGRPLYGYFRERLELLQDDLSGYVRAGQRDGEFRPDVDATQIGFELMAFLDGLEAQWLLDSSINLVAQSDTYLDRLIAYLSDVRPSEVEVPE